VRPVLIFLALLLAVAAALLSYGFCSGVIERSFIYFPERELLGDPAEHGLAFDDVTFTTDDGVGLHGWFVPGESDVTWLWFHGNAGNISDRLENLRLLRDELGVAVFLFDYRGYGRSEGSPSEERTYRDAEAALAYLLSRPDVDPERIVYFGRSLGAGVAVELATRHAPYALILESPMASIGEMVRHHYRFLPIGWLIRTKYDSLSKIESVRAPLLVLHGDRDEIVPFKGGRKLFEAANEPKRFYTIEDAGHNDTVLVGGREYFGALREFIESLP
jgi:fermentation-respiration switch protein FrsA (DUF1100 family)